MFPEHQQPNETWLEWLERPCLYKQKHHDHEVNLDLDETLEGIKQMKELLTDE